MKSRTYQSKGQHRDRDHHWGAFGKLAGRHLLLGLGLLWERSKESFCPIGAPLGNDRRPIQ